MQLRNLLVAGAVLSWLAQAEPGYGQDQRPFSSEGNRLTYLDGNDPFYPGLTFPKLITPQWIGETGVEAVVILAIDDMRETERYEKFLRPILERLKQIDGRAPVSIMVNAIAPTNAQLQAWLKEGVSLEVHTLAHPCPCLAKGDFNAALNTYYGCVELLDAIPGNRPVAFRMPCCDSMNSPSPRFYAEIFNHTNGPGQFLTIDSSVMNIPTAKDASLPRALVLEADGRERFRKYLPKETNATTKVSMKVFGTTIEDYPYPYVIGDLCWEFPAMVPSDWEAFNLHGSTNPVTLADWKAALDLTVLKQGVFTFIFHPHGWSSPQQFVEFIDYAVRQHGRKVKFLNFREAQERLNKNLLAGHPLRSADGAYNGVRLLDLNNDGYLDVVMDGAAGSSSTRLWQPASRTWRDLANPFRFRRLPGEAFSARFGVLERAGRASLLTVLDKGDAHVQQAWTFTGANWEARPEFFKANDADGFPLLTSTRSGMGGPFLLRDLDGDGRCELMAGPPGRSSVHEWLETERVWKKLPYGLPKNVSILDENGGDAGLRFVDVNGDGYDDVLFSNEKEFSLHLFVAKANPRLMFEVGWNDEVFAGKRGENDLDIPRIVRSGPNRNNGVWFRDGAMWVQNEDTAHLPDKVDRRSFRELLTLDQPRAMAPEQSLAAMRPRPGFQVELVAAEPLVQDPIAFEWGPDGKLWVVEMGDYPLGLDGKGKPGGRIKFLEDLDGDGRYDKATVFLEGVNFPTGVLPWRKGVLVSAAPEIFYAEDQDGDGKADVRTTLFSGFKEGNQQHRVNGFEYGLDNWIYCANGESGGSIRSAQKPGQPALSINGRDFRFRPDEGVGEAVAGPTQFGRHRDDWGNWFGNNNPVWLWHFHIPEHYVMRNPQLALKTTRHLLANYENATRLYPASRTRQRFNDHHQFNHVTSGNSATPYRDELFGPDFATSVFVSDPVHNVIHREVLEPDGVTFTSHRAGDETNREFLASADNWFRPTMLKTGPDGALYVADMYRQVLEHPEWIPVFIQPRLDLRAGADKGRIYRIFPVGATLRRGPRLDLLETTDLTAALESANGWQRDAAQRLLVERGDRAAAAPLRKLLEHPRAKTRLQALCTLEGMGLLSPNDLVRALRDAHPAVREHGVRLSEPWLGATAGTPPELLAALWPLENDPEIRVRYQLAFSLGESADGRVGSVLARLALRDASVAEMQIAVMSSATNHLEGMLDFVFGDGANASSAPRPIEQLVGLAAGLGETRTLVRALTRLAGAEAGGAPAPHFAAYAAFLDGIAARGQTPAEFAKTAGGEASEALQRLAPLFVAAQSTALDEAADLGQRRGAIRLLGRATEEQALARLGELLRPQYSSELQREAVLSLAHRKDSRAAQILLAGWDSDSPSLRLEVVTALLSRPAWVLSLLDAIESSRISAGQINAANQQKLLKHPDSAVRERAAKLFAVIRPDRKALLKEYASVSQLKGDKERGMALFRQNCATCHRWSGEGNEVGPELAGMADKSVPALLVAILDPNQAVEDRYVSYNATTKNGREFSGLVVSETPNSLTLRAPGGREEILLRSELQELRGSGLSLMPEGFEKTLQPQDVADLIALLTGR